MNWKRFARPSFLVAAGLLLTIALSLKAVVASLGMVWIKEPIKLQRDLATMPDRMGPYKVVRKEPRLPKDQEDALGTKHYISWMLHDTRLAKEEPGALLRLHVPYYTGNIDTVPHVPDVCFVAGGATAVGKSLDKVTLQSPYLSPVQDNQMVRATTTLGRTVVMPDREVPITVVQFKAGDGGFYTATYFFVANNDYTATPEGVRLKAFNMTDRYAYHCKVEVMPLGVGEPDRAAEVVGEFLSYALPEVFACLPDWEAANNPQPQAVAAAADAD